MEKIAYIKPTTEVVRIETHGLLQDQSLDGAEAQNGATFGAPSRMGFGEEYDELDSYGSIDETYERRTRMESE